MASSLAIDRRPRPRRDPDLRAVCIGARIGFVPGDSPFVIDRLRKPNSPREVVLRARTQDVSGDLLASFRSTVTAPEPT
jgi:hypothetical protein